MSKIFLKSLVILFLVSTSIVDASSQLPIHHPLRADRIAVERPNSSRQFSYNVEKKFQGVSDRFGNGDLDGAMESLRSMMEWNLSKYEKAVVYQFMGFVYVQQNNIDEAIRVFKKVVDLNVLSNSQHQSTQFNLASLYGSQEKWDLAIETLMMFYKFQKEPVSESYIMTGIAYFQKGQPLEALPYIHIANEKALKPKEQWLQLELAILFINKRYDEAIEVVTKLSTYWPEKEKYWETMAGTYMEMQKDADALAALSLGYKNDAISKAETLENLARLNLYLEIPYQAATLIEKNIDRGSIENNEKNLRLLLGAWTAAREFDKAIGVIDILAPLTGEGKLYIQKAMLLNENGDWKGVQDATEKALTDTGLENPGDVYILRGMAETELGNYDQAVESFSQAIELGSETNKRNAEAWIEYVSDRKGS
jgi:tetratricopeptide (TPR) repeat protein